MANVPSKTIKRAKQYLLRHVSHDYSSQETLDLSPVICSRLEDAPGQSVSLKQCMEILWETGSDATTSSKCLICESLITHACEATATFQGSDFLNFTKTMLLGPLQVGVSRKCHDCALILAALRVSRITDTFLVRVRAYNEPGDTEVQVELRLLR
jgi:hypothetical protein